MPYQIIIGIVIVICILLILILLGKNKFNFSIIKIEEAESNIEIYLEKKRNLLERAIPILKKELKQDDFLKSLDKLDKEVLNHFQTNALLHNAYLELLGIIDENEKLLKSKTIKKIIKDLDSNEQNRIGSVKYYNDNVTNFNKLVNSFPTSIIAFFCRYKNKDYYNDEDKEIDELLENEESEVIETTDKFGEDNQKYESVKDVENDDKEEADELILDDEETDDEEDFDEEYPDDDENEEELEEEIDDDEDEDDDESENEDDQNTNTLDEIVIDNQDIEEYDEEKDK
ncbi:MAG: LemA family protein [Bacilli bacterium]|nr:LemA family protein [Bacilli bacterium]